MGASNHSSNRASFPLLINAAPRLQLSHRRHSRESGLENEACLHPPLGRSHDNVSSYQMSFLVHVFHVASTHTPKLTFLIRRSFSAFHASQSAVPAVVLEWLFGLCLLAGARALLGDPHLSIPPPPLSTWSLLAALDDTSTGPDHLQFKMCQPRLIAGSVLSPFPVSKPAPTP